MITIIALVGCPYSDASIQRVINSGYKYEVKYIDNSMKDYWKNKNNYPTFPQISINGRLIGGYNEFIKILGTVKS